MYVQKPIDFYIYLLPRSVCSRILLFTLREREMAESNQSGMFKKLSVAGSLFRSAFVRSSSSDSSPQTEPNEENGWVLASRLKENDVLQPFTAGWQLAKLDPFIVEKSKGCYLYDSNGKRYLDAMAGLWCTSLGGSESRLVAAATAQLSKLPFYHSFSDCMTNPTLELAKELIDLFTPTKMGKVFFTNSGSEANDSQVKVVRYYNNALGRPNKKKFISRLNSYHGTTVATASLSGLPILHKKFDLPEPFVVYTDNPHYWRFHLPDETEEDYSSRLANNLENLILKEGPDTIAAFIAEPVMGGGGAIIPPKTYFEKIQAVLRKYDILLIIDEVITGFGRVGTMFACEQYNIQPDLLSIAKALSSGYVPIGAILISPKICEVILAQSNKIGTFAHGFTYSGHPVPCAVALETLKIYKERNIIDHVQAISPRFVDGIKAFSNSPIIGEVRGIGLILGTTFSQNKSPHDMFPLEWGVGHIFEVECRKRGLLVHAAEDDTVVFSPPLVISSKEVDELISIFGEALKSTEEKVEKLQADKKNCLVKYP